MKSSSPGDPALSFAIFLIAVGLVWISFVVFITGIY
jgi:hypothetical protein